MELRSEESLDVQPYCFLRETKKIVVPLGKELRELEQRFGAMVEKVLAKLERFNVIQKRPLSTWSKYQLLQAKDQFNRNSSAFAAVSFLYFNFLFEFGEGEVWGLLSKPLPPPPGAIFSSILFILEPTRRYYGKFRIGCQSFTCL